MQSDILPVERSENVVLLQVTDTHLFANPEGALLGVQTLDSFHAIVDEINHQTPMFDAILATGDISQDHTKESYQRFADGIAPLIQPCYWLPGNHDYKPSMQSVLPSDQIKACEHVLLGEHWQIILLDSQVQGVPHGELSEYQLNLLDSMLGQHSERHSLILLHHHPMSAGSAWLDQHQLHNNTAFWDTLSRHNNVQGILCGHIHQELDRMINGVRLLASPSTCIQFLPDSDDFALDQQGPGWRLLELTPAGEIVTKVHRLKGSAFQPNFTSTGY